MAMIMATMTTCTSGAEPERAGRGAHTLCSFFVSRFGGYNVHDGDVYSFAKQPLAEHRPLSAPQPSLRHISYFALAVCACVGALFIPPSVGLERSSFCMQYTIVK